MISEKMLRVMEKGGAIRKMFEEGKRLAALHGSENVYNFSIGNPNFPAPNGVKSAIIDIANEEDPIALHGYMNNAGFADVRKTIADSLNKKFGTSFEEKNIMMSVGAAGGLNVVLKTLLNPGDEVIAIAPYFVDYGWYVENFDGKFIITPANSDDFQPNFEKLAACITSKTKALIINSPNNPTGVIYSEETIRKISAVLEEKQLEFGISIYIISDEPYREIVYDGAEVPYITKYYNNSIICYSWSKSLSLPGERIGYVVLPSELSEYELIFSAATVATRILGFVNAPAIQQKVVARCLDEKTDIRSYDTNRKLLFGSLEKLGFECVFPQGAFYLWVKTPCDDIEFAESAKKYNILLVPGTSFGYGGYARIAYCVSKETIENSMPAFKKLAELYNLG